MLRILDFIFPGKARLQQELQKAKKEIIPLTENLVAWEEDELELMSLIQEEREVKKTFEKSVSGIICSIYHEHMAAYQWRKLTGIGDIEVMVIETKKYVYEYVRKNGKTSFYVNNQFLGEFRKDNRLYLQKNKPLGWIEQDSGEWWDIYYQDQAVGGLVNIAKAREVNPRAFRLIRGINVNAEIVFLAIALYKIVMLTKGDRKLDFR